MDDMSEVEHLKEQLKNVKEAAEYWENRYRSFYEKVDADVEKLGKQIDLVKINYDLMYNTLKNIVYYCNEPDEMFTKARQWALNCVIQVALNHEKEKEKK